MIKVELRRTVNSVWVYLNDLVNGLIKCPQMFRGTGQNTEYLQKGAPQFKKIDLETKYCYRQTSIERPASGNELVTGFEFFFAKQNLQKLLLILVWKTNNIINIVFFFKCFNCMLVQMDCLKATSVSSMSCRNCIWNKCAYLHLSFHLSVLFLSLILAG